MFCASSNQLELLRSLAAVEAFSGMFLRRFAYYLKIKEVSEIGPGSNIFKLYLLSLQCPVCHIEFNDNYLLMTHLYQHAIPSKDGSETPQCPYCLTRFPSEDELTTHLKHNHPADTKSPDLFTYACLICEVSSKLG